MGPCTGIRAMAMHLIPMAGRCMPVVMSPSSPCIIHGKSITPTTKEASSTLRRLLRLPRPMLAAGLREVLTEAATANLSLRAAVTQLAHYSRLPTTS